MRVAKVELLDYIQIAGGHVAHPVRPVRARVRDYQRSVELVPAEHFKRVRHAITPRKVTVLEVDDIEVPLLHLSVIFQFNLGAVYSQTTLAAKSSEDQLLGSVTLLLYEVPEVGVLPLIFRVF